MADEKVQTTREQREAAVLWVYGCGSADLTEHTQRWVETGDGRAYSQRVDSLAVLLATREAAAVERAVAAESLLGRIVKYAREDRARTPGVTRLARALDEANTLLRSRLPRAGAEAVGSAEMMQLAREADRDSLSERLRSACEERGALEMEAERHVVASCVRAAMAEAERDAARSTLSRATERGERLAEEMRVALAKLREIPFAATQVFATVAYATCVLGEALAEDARDAAGGEDGHG